MQSIDIGIGHTIQAYSMGGHLGQKRTLKKITKYYSFPEITRDVASSVYT